MSLSSANLTALQAIDAPQIAEVLAVYWDGESNPPTYYGKARWNELGNYLDCPFAPVEPRLLGDGLTPIPLFPDINSQAVQFTFADADGAIKALFIANGSPKAELHYYFPDIGASSVQWFGFLDKPKIYGLKTQEVQANSGFRSPEFMLPSEIRMKECSARVFGGNLATQADIDRNLCPYNKHLGGSEGVNNPATSAPWVDCPRLTKADCSARFGHDRYFGGYDFEARGVTVTSQFIQSKARNNDSLLRYPIGLVMGKKILMEIPVMQFYTRQDVSNTNRGTVHVIGEVSNDSCDSVFNVLYNGSTSNVQNTQIRLGARGQSPTGWVSGVSNYSGRTIFYAVGSNSANPVSITNANAIKVGCFVHGFNKVREYSNSTTFSETNSTDRVWCTLELMTNPRWGLGYRHSRFEIDDWIDASDWTQANVRFTLPLESGDKTWDITKRTIFDVYLTGAPANEVLTNIARTGRFSVPYQRDGKYTVSVLSKATGTELTNALVFTDALGGNILRTSDTSSLAFSESDTKALKNTVVVTFEDADNNDITRPITCRDQDAAAAAGAELGSGGFKENKASYTAFGVRRLEECVKFGYSLLWFGEFDSGGTRNNCKAEFATTLRQALNLRKFQVVKIESDQNAFGFDYFRVLDGKINADGSVSVSCQAYNDDAYADYETELTGGEPSPTENNTVGTFAPEALPESATVSATYSSGYLTVTVT